MYFLITCQKWCCLWQWNLNLVKVFKCTPPQVQPLSSPQKWRHFHLQQSPGLGRITACSDLILLDSGCEAENDITAYAKRDSWNPCVMGAMFELQWPDRFPRVWALPSNATCHGKSHWHPLALKSNSFCCSLSSWSYQRGRFTPPSFPISLFIN